MSKYLKNIGKAVISFGNKNFIPGTKPVKVTDTELANPMIEAYIKAKKLELVESAGNSSNPQNELTELESMSPKQLIKYANEKGINIGDAKEKEDILATIKESIKTPLKPVY